MKTRLTIFTLALLLLPPLGLLLGGRDWSELAVAGVPPAGNDIAAMVATLLALLCYALLTNLIVTLRIGANPLVLQRNYFIALGAASAVLGWLLSYLNLFAESWSTAAGDSFVPMLLGSLLFALLVPAVLSTRALLGLSGTLLRALARGPALPAPASETLIFLLIPLVLLGLLGGVTWPAQLFWLLWLAPLLLLIALQLLWHESTVFSGLIAGDWGRVVHAILAGLIVGNLTVYGFKAVGGSLLLAPSAQLFAQAGFAVFGLLCLQLGDVIAERWRGIQRGELFQKKKFPIPVVTKKK